MPLHPTNPLFYKLEILKGQDVFKLQLSKCIFNCLQLNTPTIFHNWFRLNDTAHNYNARSTYFDIANGINSYNIFIINVRTTHFKVNTTSKEQSTSSLKLIYRRLQLNLVFRQVPIRLPKFPHIAWVNSWLMVFRHLPRVPLYSVVENIMKCYRHDQDSNPGLCGENQTC